MTRLEMDQPRPAVKFESDNDATVRLVVDGARTPEWRAEFNERARSEHVPVEAWWIEGATVLQVNVTYRTDSDPINVFQTLSNTVQLLNGADRVPLPKVVENPAKDLDTRGVIEAAVESWWGSYRSLIARGRRSAGSLNSERS